MNPRNGVPDADLSCRPGQDDASEAIGVSATAGHGAGEPTRYLRAHRPVQDIQDLIDKLAAVTQQLCRPGSSRVGSPR